MANDNSFWTGDDDGMAQKYTGPLTAICLANQLSVFNLGAEVPKQIVKLNFRFSIWERKFQNE